jgi:hypothetical protein
LEFSRAEKRKGFSARFRPGGLPALAAGGTFSIAMPQNLKNAAPHLQRKDIP